MQAALGRLQLRKLTEWSQKRRANAAVLTERLSNVPGLQVPQPPAHVRHAYYRFYARVEIEKLRRGWDRDRIVAEVTQRGIPCFSGSCSELYREKAFSTHGLVPEQQLATLLGAGQPLDRALTILLDLPEDEAAKPTITIRMAG